MRRRHIIPIFLLFAGVLALAAAEFRKTGDESLREDAREVFGQHSTVEVSAGDFKASLLRIYPDIKLEGEPESWLSAVPPGEAGSISIGDREVSALAMSQLFSLGSPDFRLEWTGENFLFTLYPRS